MLPRPIGLLSVEFRGAVRLTAFSVSPSWELGSNQEPSQHAHTRLDIYVCATRRARRPGPRRSERIPAVGLDLRPLGGSQLGRGVPRGIQRGLWLGGGYRGSVCLARSLGRTGSPRRTASRRLDVRLEMEPAKYEQLSVGLLSAR